MARNTPAGSKLGFQEGSPKRLLRSDQSPASSRVISGLVDSVAQSWSGWGDIMSGFRNSRNGRRARVRRWIWLPILVLAAVPAPSSLRAQGPNRGAPKFDPDWSVPAANLLRNAAAHVRGKQWSEAIQMYQKVIEQYGNKVAALPADEQEPAGSSDFVLYVDDRWYCHRVIAKLPPEAREIYRKRVDGVAERWYRQGEADRDLTLFGAWSTRLFAARGAMKHSSCWVTWRSRTVGLARPWRRTGELVADHPDDAVGAGASRSFGRSGAGGGQEASCAGRPRVKTRRGRPS